MADWKDPQQTRSAWGAAPQPQLNGADIGAVTMDQGLRKYMLSIYNYMASGVLLSGIVAMLFAESGLALQVMSTPLRWVIMLAPLVFIFTMNYNRSASTLQMMYWSFCVIMGLSLSTIFLVFTDGSIATTFAATAGAFAGLSLFGYTTKRNLSAMGSFMMMGLFGIIIAMLLNMWVGSTALELAISILGVVIFAGLTAWHTQSLRETYYQVVGTEMMAKVVIIGALTLYLDFINMFRFLLSFLGSRE